MRSELERRKCSLMLVAGEEVAFPNPAIGSLQLLEEKMLSCRRCTCGSAGGLRGNLTL